jgi:hypothetical protein
MDSRIEKNTTILSNRSKILQKRNKHSDYIMIKYLSHYNNFIVNVPCNEKNIFKNMIFLSLGRYFYFFNYFI